MTEAWTVAVGNVPFFKNKRVKKALEIISKQEGLIGVHPVPPRGNLLLFDTENNAKGARNMLTFYGIECGDNICKVMYDEISN